MSRKKTSGNSKVAQIVTDQIVAALDEERIPWERPWVNARPRSYSGHVYSGINPLLLGLRGFSSPVWGTFKQWTDTGSKIKKGSKSSIVVFFKKIHKVETTEELNPVTGELEKVEKDLYIPILRYYRVFNAEQVELSDTAKATIDESVKTSNERVYEAEHLPASYLSDSNGPDLVFNVSLGRASYSPVSDVVTLPPINQYKEVSAYYSTLFHELIHSTGHESRLARLTENSVFGSTSYSYEELVAEIGAAILCNYSNVESAYTAKQHTAYCQGWAEKLDNNPRWVIAAAGQADKAASYIVHYEEEREEIE